MLWPSSRLGEAVHALARSAGLPTTCRETFGPDPDLTPDQLSTWIEAAADRGGLQASQAVARIDEIPGLALGGAPLLLRLGAADGGGFLAVVGADRQRLVVLGPDLHRHRIALNAILESVSRPFAQPLEAEIDRLLEKMQISPGRRPRARAALLNERLTNVRLRSCWLLRLPPGSSLAHEVRETRLTGGVALFISAHVIQYLLFIASWWLLGRGVLSGTLDSGWLLGWILLLVSVVPFRLLATWTQGTVATTAGAALRRRLLRGAFRIERETVRRQGPGELFGTVVEAAAIESLALTGGLMACFSILELVIAAAVLWSGAGLLPAALLLVWMALAGAFAWRYVRSRRAWTSERLSMTHDLLESMIGHRTRLAQQPVEQWHPQEDLALTRYIESGRIMDRSSAWLTAFIPRGWLTVGLVALAPAIVAHASPARLAITVGGVLLAHRSLRRLSAGLSNLAGAAIAGRAILPLARAAANREAAPHPSMVVPRPQDSSSAADSVAVHARDLSFRYPLHADPVLRGCSLVVPRGARLLLEGASGAGKTTFASILAGLEAPDSGMLLVDGLDRSVLGAAGWRQRVVMAPQAHDNYLVSGSLAFNLLMGRRWPAQQSDFVEAEQVCRELGLGDLLARMPGGLHQMVGETGWQLSQGERTRVFLARALLQKPELLLLDESFSALDPENVDRTIRCVLKRASTVIAVAHA